MIEEKTQEWSENKNSNFVPIGVRCNPYFWKRYMDMVARWSALGKRHFAHDDRHGPGHLVKRK